MQVAEKVKKNAPGKLGIVSRLYSDMIGGCGYAHLAPDLSLLIWRYERYPMQSSALVGPATCVDDGFMCVFSAQRTSLRVVLIVYNTLGGVVVRLIYCTSISH